MFPDNQARSKRPFQLCREINKKFNKHEGNGRRNDTEVVESGNKVQMQNHKLKRKRYRAIHEYIVEIF